MRKLTPGGSPEFEEWLAQQLNEIGESVHQALGSNLVALILGGGYGRGEGAVVWRDGREWPYNDLDFTIIVRDPKGVSAALASISHRFSQQMRIEVDFSRPVTLSQVAHWPHTLMWHELLLGHIVVCGNQDVLSQHCPKYLHSMPPLAEGSRLLLNRGAGLLWALRVAEGLEQAPDQDFCRRNLFKAQMAQGDVALMWGERYTISYQERPTRYQQLDGWPLAPADYQLAMQFKMNPDSVDTTQPSGAQLLAVASNHLATLLRFDGLRLGRDFADGSAYANEGKARENWPVGLLEALKNLIRNLRVGRWGFSHPRQYLYFELVELLESALRGQSDWSVRSIKFLEIWRLYN